MKSVNIICACDGYVYKWHKSTDSRKKFAKAGDKIVTLTSVEGQMQYDINSPISGNISSCYFDVGSYVESGTIVGTIIPCNHPALFNSMCVSCGDIINLRFDESSDVTASNNERVTILTSGKQLQLTKTEADYFQEAKQSGLRSSKKLALVLDLDHTLIHACERAIPANDKEKEQGIMTLSLEESPANGLRHYLIKFRPHLMNFLFEMSKFCQLSIYTAGTRKYAEGVAKLIDPEGKLFLGRIVSRTDNTVNSNNGFDDKIPIIEKSLSKLFLADTSLAVILDDREDVWRGVQGKQLLLVRPYKYFSDIPDVNNSSGNMSFSNSDSQLQQQPAILLASEPPGVTASNDAADNEHDDQLLRSSEIIKEIHSKIYPLSTSESLINNFSSNKDNIKNIDNNDVFINQGNPKIYSTNVASIMNMMKAQILHGYCITFSGIIPINCGNGENHFLWQLATSLGAKVTYDLSPYTTHLICTNLSSAKVNEGRNRGNIWILHPDWLFYCRWSMAKALETTFSLIPVDSNNVPKPTWLPPSDKNVSTSTSRESVSSENKNVNVSASTQRISNSTNVAKISTSEYSNVRKIQIDNAMSSQSILDDNDSYQHDNHFENTNTNSQTFKRARVDDEMGVDNCEDACEVKPDSSSTNLQPIVEQENSKLIENNKSQSSKGRNKQLNVSAITIEIDSDSDSDFDNWDLEEAIQSKRLEKSTIN